MRSKHWPCFKGKSWRCFSRPLLLAQQQQQKPQNSAGGVDPPHTWLVGESTNEKSKKWFPSGLWQSNPISAMDKRGTSPAPTASLKTKSNYPQVFINSFHRKRTINEYAIEHAWEGSNAFLCVSFPPSPVYFIFLGEGLHAHPEWKWVANRTEVFLHKLWWKQSARKHFEGWQLLLFLHFPIKRRDKSNYFILSCRTLPGRGRERMQAQSFK